MNRFDWKALGLSRSPPELVLILIYMAVIVAGMAAFGILVWLAHAIISGSADEINKLLLSLAGIFGIPFVVWRTIIAAQQVSVARESHYTSLFTKASEQLGAIKEVKGTDPSSGGVLLRTEPNIEVRLGAIYALERIALDSERDHSPIMETLCAYIKENSKEAASEPERQSPGSPAYAAWLNSLPRPRVDILAALKVLGRRPRHRIAREMDDVTFENEITRFDLRGVNLQGARLINLRLAHVDLSGSALHGAFMARVDFADAELHFCQLQGSTMLSCSFERARFIRSDLRETDVRSTIARHASLPDSDFSDAKIVDSDFGGAELAGAKFRQAFVRRSVFNGADMTGSHLSGSSWTDCEIKDARFEYVECASEYDGRVGGADLSRTVGLTQEQIETCFGTPKVKLPPQLQIPESWRGASDEVGTVIEQ